MSLNLNKIFLAGRLTADPECRTTQSGINFVSFTIAANRPQTSESGEKKADFIRCVAWRHTADFIREHFAKGMAIFAEGSLQIRSWTDKEGKANYAYEVVVQRAEFVESKTTLATTSDNIQDAPTNMSDFDDLDNTELPF